MPSRGVIYLASGGRSYLGELITSLKSLRQFEPDLPVTVYSKFKIPAALKVDHVVYESPEHPLKQKVLVLPKSPYEETLFLDTDTTIFGRIQPIFEHLQYHDFGVANMAELDWSVQPPRLIKLVRPNDYNTGVLLYRRGPQSAAFLEKWASAVLQQDASDMWAGHNCDQDYFNLLVREGAFAECAVDFAPLDNCLWNVRGAMQAALQTENRWQEVRIFHHRTRAMKLRKLCYSFTDLQTFWEIVRKIFNRLTGNRFLKNSVPRA